MPQENSKISIANIVGPGARITFGESSYGKGERFGPMFGRQLEAIYLRTGRVRVAADDQRFEMAAPNFALVCSTRRLEYRYGANGQCNVLWCQCLDTDFSHDRIVNLKPYCGVAPLSQAATSLIKMGVDLPLGMGSATQEFSSALGLALLEELLMRKKLMVPVDDVPQQIARVRKYIEDNLGAPLTMASFSKISGLSPQHLNRLYRKSFSENPLDYLWRLRVRRGAFLLRHTGTRISQIAYETGFKTPNHFSRLIKNRYGLSPRDLRRQGWRGSSDLSEHLQ